MWAAMQEQRTWDGNARINNVRQKVQEMNMGPKKKRKKRKQDKYEAEQEKQEEC